MNKKSILFVICLTFSSSVGFADLKRAIFSYTISNYPVEKILDSLQNGHKAEIRYQIKAYREVSGIRKVLGDQLVGEKTLTYVARKDLMDGSYKVTINNDIELSLAQETDFTDFFLTLNREDVDVQTDTLEGIYILCRYRIQPIKLVAPLTLLTLVWPKFVSTSEWIPIAFTIEGS